MANKKNWDKWCPTWRILLLYTHISALCDLILYAAYSLLLMNNRFNGLGVFFFGYMLYLTPYFCINYRVLVDRKKILRSNSLFWKGFWPFLLYDAVVIILAIITLKQFLSYF